MINIIKNCVGFDWDNGNESKNWEKHKVSKVESEQVFFNDPLLIFESTKLDEERYLALGKTNSKRYLAIVFAVRKQMFIRVISARPMSKKERRVYEYEE